MSVSASVSRCLCVHPMILQVSVSERWCIVLGECKVMGNFAEARVDTRHGFSVFLITHMNTETREREGSRKGASETETETERERRRRPSLMLLPEPLSGSLRDRSLVHFSKHALSIRLHFSTRNVHKFLDSLVRVSRRVQISKKKTTATENEEDSGREGARTEREGEEEEKRRDTNRRKNDEHHVF